MTKSTASAFVPASAIRYCAMRQAQPVKFWALWLGFCLVVIILNLLIAFQGDVQRGQWKPSQALFNTLWSLWPALVLSAFLFSWVDRVRAMQSGTLARLSFHFLASLLFSTAWIGLTFLAGYFWLGLDYAQATCEQTILADLIRGEFVYGILIVVLDSFLNARQARANAISAAQAESARVKAELSAITGKLNPHFLFNTLNSLIALTRKDAKAAEQSLLRFSGMLRYVLSTKRSHLNKNNSGPSDRVSVSEEIDFVKDYLSLEALRLGKRLTVDWQVSDQVLEDEIPALTLQPLVENSIIHGIAPRIQGGTITVIAQRIFKDNDRTQPLLKLVVSDDGAGCDLALASNAAGIAVKALSQRFSLDYGGRAQLVMLSAPNAGFKTEITIPQ